jgi:hypothetical protein
MEIDEDAHKPDDQNDPINENGKESDMKEEIKDEATNDVNGPKVVEIDDQGNPINYEDENGVDDVHNKSLENPESNNDVKVEGTIE